MSNIYKNFKYSHTIEPDKAIQVESQSQDMNALFKIGHNFIEKSQKSESQKSQKVQEIIIHKEINKEKKIKKEKRKQHKQHKEKKEKKQKKHKKKQKKHKKKDSYHQQIKSQSQSIQFHNNKVTTVAPTINFVSLQQYFTNKANQELMNKINSNFAYNEKISEDLLPFSVIKFPEKGLYQYGLSNKDIPRYRRINYNIIIGLKSSKYTNEVLKQLNKIINQKDQVQIDKNQNRYFSYQFDRNQGQKIKRIDQRKDADPTIIQFDSSFWAEYKSTPLTNLKRLDIDHKNLEYSEAEVLRLNKQYNNELVKNPNDINLWLKFIGIQDQIANLSGFSKNKNNLYERKLSIVQKALEKNSNEIQFKILLINYFYELKKGDYYSKICQKCLTYIDQHPESIELWQIYLDFRFSQFSSFSNSFIRKQFEDITKNLRKKIQQATSASLIWKIRTASLFVLSKIISILKLQGYQQLATGICQALLQYNIFIPEKINASNNYNFRAQAFKNYWQDYKVYRIGQTQQYTCWDTYYQNIGIYDQKKYIGQTQLKLKKLQMKQQKSYQWVDIQLESKKNLGNWRPSHVNHDNQRIQESPQSFVLIEDIEHLLQIYRDNQNLQILVDLVFEYFGFPPVFSVNCQIRSQYNSKYIFHKLIEQIKNQNYQHYSESDKLDIWNKFWHPSQISVFLTNNFITKFLYLKRLLTSLKKKLPNTHVIDIYLMYLEIATYTEPKLLKAIYDDNQDQCKLRISLILESNLKNIEIWICYIEGEHLKRNNTQQCFGVYKQLLSFEGLSRKKIYKILYYFLVSMRKWNGKVDVVLSYILTYLKDHQPHEIMQKQLKPFQILLLFKLLLQRYKQFQQSKKKDQNKNKLTKRHILSYMILQLANIYEPSQEVTSAISKIKQRLISECFKDFYSCIVLLRTKQKYQLKKLQVIPKHLCQIQYIIFNYQSPTFLIKYHLNNIFPISLASWMIAFSFFIKSYNEKLIQLFFLYGKELVSSNQLSSRQINYTIRFAKLLCLYKPDTKFLFTCIDHIPYAKDLFLYYIKVSKNEEQRIKIKKILYEKQLRIVNKQ